MIRQTIDDTVTEREFGGRLRHGAEQPIPTIDDRHWNAAQRQFQRHGPRDGDRCMCGPERREFLRLTSDDARQHGPGGRRPA